MSIVLDGTKIAGEIRGSVRDEAKLLKQKTGIVPGLAVVLVGDDPASEIYVGRKAKACEEAGFASRQYRLAAATGEGELLNLIDVLNKDSLIHGILVQLPLPVHISTKKVIAAIDPLKDVDGFHPTNVGRMVIGLPAYVPATPLGILRLIEHYQIPTEGKNVVVLGRSNIVGTPISVLLSRKAYPGNATVTLCHSKSAGLAEITLRADIIIAALGATHFIKADMVKDGAVVIDVGMNQIPDSSAKKGTRLVGDVDFVHVSPKCSFITPVPGGVGPMTVCALMINTWEAYNRSIYG